MNDICVRCGKKIQGEVYFEGDIPLCWKCYCRAQQDKQIHNTTYQPVPVFYGFGNHYYVMTVDLMGRVDGEKICQIMRRINQGKELVYCRRGSHDGVELVSHPMSREFAHRFVNWTAALQEAASLGYRVRRLWVRSVRIIPGPKQRMGEQKEKYGKMVSFFY